ncbi:hypothetical protein RclHR1_00590031 [Rhizophagus clarus]|uniref:Uncharacterized protein n=1 Tax=Rhizophagus clarus TaxID=94130 RepID=A0A2Z6S200_9GLOM|nr:hypothetical protein RclHR1_00590031 [Rhizophagus clarus]GES92490.1 hypothetical protein GLOIN_2v1868691 [Rhizophagus clarus]
MEPVNIKIYIQELERFQKKHLKAFKADSLILPESSFSLLSSEERRELSKIYFNLVKSIIENGTTSEEPQALDYLNTSIRLDATCNKGAYAMIAKICAINNDIIGAYANILISVALGETSRDDEFFIQQCKRMLFPTPEVIKKHNQPEDVLHDLLKFKDVVLVLEPGTYNYNHDVDRNGEQKHRYHWNWRGDHKEFWPRCISR